MKKTYVVILVVALILGLAVPAALAITDNQKAELQKLYEEQHQLQLRILEKQTEAGLVTPEDAEQFRARMQERWEWRKQKMAEGDYQFGFGRGRFGKGGFRGRGPCGNRGGCGNCPKAETTPGS